MMVFWKQKTINELNWFDWEWSFGVINGRFHDMLHV